MLSNSQGNILDDEELINTLAQSKVQAGGMRPTSGLSRPCTSAVAVIFLHSRAP